LNKVATKFTIKDLENLSGIKAHTIRIWEKRYAILEPDRTDSNIRFYDTINLKKLLNVTQLYNAGYKISKIAKLPENELAAEVKDVVTRSGQNSAYMDHLTLSMFQFDQALFEQTFNRLVAEYSFRHVFLEVFVPLLHKIGLQWQSNSITPVQEHFITNLIKQKLHLSIERVQQSVSAEDETTYVLFLPDNEIHELGLLYLHYEMLLKGRYSIYLGQSVPLENLTSIQAIFSKVQFIGYFTVMPKIDNIDGYLARFNRELLEERNDSLWITGTNAQAATVKNEKIKVFNNLSEIINNLPS